MMIVVAGSSAKDSCYVHQIWSSALPVTLTSLFIKQLLQNFKGKSE
tara:strand:- start:12 stop:149 length:138 start_codon:yes stop_codon:yes gene_type:complete